jgi:hypothetical protein
MGKSRLSKGINSELKKRLESAINKSVLIFSFKPQRLLFLSPQSNQSTDPLLFSSMDVSKHQKYMCSTPVQAPTGVSDEKVEV